LLPGGESGATSETLSKAIQDAGGPGNILITRSLKHPEYASRTLAQIASEKSISPVELYLQIVRDGGARVVVSSMSDKDNVHSSRTRQ